MTLKDEDFPNFTDSELLRLSNGMRATALRAGIRFADSDRKVFATTAELIKHCQDFNRTIRMFLDTDAKDYEDNISPGMRRLRAHPNAEAIRQATLADNTRARSRINGVQAMTDVEGAAAPAEAEGKKKRKVRAPAAKGAKKGAKKVAKKAAAAKKPAKAKAAKSDSAPRVAADGELRIVPAKNAENKLRPGTGQYERRQQVLKFFNKTKQQYLTAGGNSQALTYAIKDGVCSLKK